VTVLNREVGAGGGLSRRDERGGMAAKGGKVKRAGILGRSRQRKLMSEWANGRGTSRWKSTRRVGGEGLVEGRD